MKIPDFFKALAFWKALSWLVAGVLGLLVFFGIVPPQYGLEAAALLAIFVAVLNFFGIYPELWARDLIERETDV